MGAEARPGEVGADVVEGCDQHEGDEQLKAVGPQHQNRSRPGAAPSYPGHPEHRPGHIGGRVVPPARPERQKEGAEHRDHEHCADEPGPFEVGDRNRGPGAGQAERHDRPPAGAHQSVEQLPQADECDGDDERKEGGLPKEVDDSHRPEQDAGRRNRLNKRTAGRFPFRLRRRRIQGRAPLVPSLRSHRQTSESSSSLCFRLASTSATF